MAVNKEEYKKLLSQFATGVTVITVAKGESKAHGMAVNSFTSVSLDPTLILICIDRQARTYPLLQKEKRFGVNMLAEEQEAVARYFADKSVDHESVEEFGLQYRFSESGTPLLHPCLAQLECRVVDTREAGDHTIFIAEVENGRGGDGRPLVFFRSRFSRLEPRGS